MLSIVERIQEIRDRVRGASKAINDHVQQLNDLTITLRLVEQEKELQTLNVSQQLSSVHGTLKELKEGLILRFEKTRQSTAKRYFHAITSGTRDEKELSEIWARLDRARTELQTRILLAQVGLAGSMRDGFTVALPTLERIDRQVQSALGARLQIATQLDHTRIVCQGSGSNASNVNALGLANEPDIDDKHLPGAPLVPRDDVIHLTGQEMSDMGLYVPPPDYSPGATVTSIEYQSSYIGNMALERAQQINGNIIFSADEKPSMSKETERTLTAKTEYVENQARGDSVQVNGNMNAQAFGALLASRASR